MLDAVWLIPALPLAGFVILTFFGKRLGEPWAGLVGTAAVGGAFVASVVTFFGLLAEDSHHRRISKTAFEWIGAGDLQVDIGVLIDPLSITMVLFVTGVSTLIHLYSIGYMHGDERFARFFTYLNLFVVAMCVLVLADNLVMTFLGWEGVGACSYLLISFWFEDTDNSVAGKKAFVTNRVGDVGFMVGTFLMFTSIGTVDYLGIAEGAAGLATVTATGIVLLFFLGAMGKSAQFPLYVWLPDAMAGPTPVSALIHAATMVTSGVFLMARLSPVLHQATEAAEIVAWVGAFTALLAATIAVAQTDIKKVLAYSTVSQLGYMFLAIGTGAYVAAIFHMVTHAFFKALMFLGAGSVIHGMDDEQNMDRMGGLMRFMPITGITFIVGWLSIAGIPPFSGFWSKDEILIYAWDYSPILWAVGVVTAALTAYYMSRQVYLVFFDKPRFDEAEVHPHESPATMTAPLVILAGLAVVGGVINLPFKGFHHLEHFLEPVFEEDLAHLDVANSLKWGLPVVVALVALGAMAAAGAVYLRHRIERRRVEPAVLADGWYYDEAISAIVGGPVATGAGMLATKVDAGGIDKAVEGTGLAALRSGELLRRLQTGLVRNYALGIAAGAVLGIAYVMSRVMV